MGQVTEQRTVVRLRNGLSSARPDALAVEQPLEIRVGGRPLTVTMRTPGHDFDLAAGVLVAEGLVRSEDQLTALRMRGSDSDSDSDSDSGEEDSACPGNVMDAAVRGDTGQPPWSEPVPGDGRRPCGPGTVQAVRARSAWDIAADPVVLDPDVLYALPDRLLAARKAFDTNGRLPAAGLFSADGELLCAREDVAEHNAADKVVGWALREGLLPLTGRILLVSGRATFEVGRKAAMAGIPALATAGAPSGLAVDLAAELGMTLVGLLRGRSASLYAGAQRIAGVPTF